MVKVVLNSQENTHTCQPTAPHTHTRQPMPARGPSHAHAPTRARPRPLTHTCARPRPLIRTSPRPLTHTHASPRPPAAPHTHTCQPAPARGSSHAHVPAHASPWLQNRPWELSGPPASPAVTPKHCQRWTWSRHLCSHLGEPRGYCSPRHRFKGHSPSATKPTPGRTETQVQRARGGSGMMVSRINPRRHVLQASWP